MSNRSILKMTNEELRKNIERVETRVESLDYSQFSDGKASKAHDKRILKTMSDELAKREAVEANESSILDVRGMTDEEIQARVDDMKRTIPERKMRRDSVNFVVILFLENELAVRKREKSIADKRVPSVKFIGVTAWKHRDGSMSLDHGHDQSKSHIRTKPENGYYLSCADYYELMAYLAIEGE